MDLGVSGQCREAERHSHRCTTLVGDVGTLVAPTCRGLEISQKRTGRPTRALTLQTRCDEHGDQRRNVEGCECPERTWSAVGPSTWSKTEGGARSFCDACRDAIEPRLAEVPCGCCVEESRGSRLVPVCRTICPHRPGWRGEARPTRRAVFAPTARTTGAARRR